MVMFHQSTRLEYPINPLPPGGYGNDFKSVIIKHMLWIKFMSPFCEIAFR